MHNRHKQTDHLLNVNTSAQFILGDWRVDPTTLSISNAHKQVRLEPKVMELLVLLAKQPGQVISRHTLENTVWAGTVVSYDAISKAMIKLRKALGDSSAQPRYVETIPKRGYRLIATVTSLQHSKIHSIQTSLRQPKFNRILSGIIVLALTISSIIFWTLSQPSLPQQQQTSRHNTALTIAVMPLHNISDNTNDNYFAAGLTSDLITDLAKLSGLRVITNQTQSTTDLSPNVHYILSGDVTRAGKQIRINIRLEDVRHQQYLWTERYNRELADIFALQDEIANKIVTSLALKVSEQEKHRIAIRYTNNIAAYDVFLRARAKLVIYTEESNHLARTLYRQAILLDQTFARAYAGLALTYALDFRHSWSSDVIDPLSQGVNIIQQALALNNDLPEVYWVLSYIDNIRGDFKQAIRHAQHTLAIEPSYADAYALLTGIYTYQKKYDQAIAAMHTALQLNPGGGHLYYLLLARAQYFDGKINSASNNLQRAYSRNPSSLETLIYLVVVNHRLGQDDEADWIYKELHLQHPQFNFQQWLTDSPLKDHQQRQQLHNDFIHP